MPSVCSPQASLGSQGALHSAVPSYQLSAPNIYHSLEPRASGRTPGDSQPIGDTGTKSPGLEEEAWV